MTGVQTCALPISALDRAAAWSAYAIAAPANIAKVETAFREELARALKDGFTEAELASAKSGILQKSVQSRSQDSAVTSGWTSNLFLGRTYAFSKQFEDKVTALKASEVSAALRKYLDPSKVTVVKAGDFTKK